MRTASPKHVPTFAQSALFVDLYELTMGESYLAEGMAERPATFQLFCRNLPQGWGYLVAAGLGDALAHLERLRFTADDLAYLESTGLFTASLLERLAVLRFTGDVRAMPEGTLFFPDEPVLEVTAPVLEAQFVETAVLNQIHFQPLITGKAARCVDAAQGRALVDFSLRRTHGAEAGLKVARASYLAGFTSTSNVLAGRLYGIPIAGTMAHSYVECFEDEEAAFEAFTSVYPSSSTLLVDTFDTVEGARRAARVAHALAERGGRLGAVRLDSGDLFELSRRVRTVLDEDGLGDVGVFVSGSLDEREIARLLRKGAPIDGFGIGSKLGVSADAPYLDMAYKLVAFDGRPVLKLSAGKATLPAAKQVWRRVAAGRLAGDLVTLVDEPAPDGAEPLLQPVMTDGVRLERDTLAAARARVSAQRAALAPEQRLLDAQPYPVELSARLVALRDVLTGSLQEHPPPASHRGNRPEVRVCPDASPRRARHARTMTHRYVEHGGEVELELEATSEAGVFEAALTAFADLVASGEEATGAGEPARYEVELDAAHRALLLVDWLTELVFLAEVKRFVPERMTALELVDNRLRATVEGHRGRPRHLVKAVTLNKLRLEHEGRSWHGRLVLDV